MRRILLTLAATAAVLVGGLAVTSTAEARPFVYGGYGYRPYYGYGPSYRAYRPYYYAQPAYRYRYYGYPGYYSGYPYYGYPYYGNGVYFGAPRAGVYFNY
jgi:hypothetical protein